MTVRQGIERIFRDVLNWTEQLYVYEKYKHDETFSEFHLKTGTLYNNLKKQFLNTKNTEYANVGNLHEIVSLGNSVLRSENEDVLLSRHQISTLIVFIRELLDAYKEINKQYSSTSALDINKICKGDDKYFEHFKTIPSYSIASDYKFDETTKRSILKLLTDVEIENGLKKIDTYISDEKKSLLSHYDETNRKYRSLLDNFMDAENNLNEIKNHITQQESHIFVTEIEEQLQHQRKYSLFWSKVYVILIVSSLCTIIILNLIYMKEKIDVKLSFTIPLISLLITGALLFKYERKQLVDIDFKVATARFLAVFAKKYSPDDNLKEKLVTTAFDRISQIDGKNDDPNVSIDTLLKLKEFFKQGK